MDETTFCGRLIPFPPEIWLAIIGFCDIPTLAKVAQVSFVFLDAAQKRLSEIGAGHWGIMLEQHGGKITWADVNIILYPNGIVFGDGNASATGPPGFTLIGCRRGNILSACTYFPSSGYFTNLLVDLSYPSSFVGSFVRMHGTLLGAGSLVGVQLHPNPVDLTSWKNTVWTRTGAQNREEIFVSGVFLPKWPIPHVEFLAGKWNGELKYKEEGAPYSIELEFYPWQCRVTGGGWSFFRTTKIQGESWERKGSAIANGCFPVIGFSLCIPSVPRILVSALVCFDDTKRSFFGRAVTRYEEGDLLEGTFSGTMESEEGNFEY